MKKPSVKTIHVFLIVITILIFPLQAEKTIDMSRAKSVNPGSILKRAADFFVETVFAGDRSDKKRIEKYYESGIEQGKSLQYYQAVQTFKQVLSINPKHENALLWLGWFYRKLAMEQSEEKEAMLKKSVDYYQRAIEVEKRAESYSELASVYLDLRMYTEAKNAADKAIEEDPENARAWNLRGLAHRFLGNFSEAKSDFEQSLELEPDDFVVEENLFSVSN